MPDSESLEIRLLIKLREEESRELPWNALEAEFPLARREVSRLVAFGFGIETSERGATYRAPSERLCPDQIEFGMSGRRIGRRIAVWNRVASTNDLAAKAASSRSNSGLVVLAEEQTRGRGRFGRTWVAPPRSSILLSALLFPPASIDEPIWINALGAIAVAEVVDRYASGPSRIKWPNDVRVNGRKVSGVLVERGLGTVLGIGLNVNSRPEEFPPEVRKTTTSLLVESGAALDRSEIARELIQAIDDLYGRLIIEGPGFLSDVLSARSEHVGAVVRVDTVSRRVEGRLHAIDLRDGLIVEVADVPEGLIRLSPQDVSAITNL